MVFETTSPFETPRKMQELMIWTRDALSDESLHPLLIVGAFIVTFLAIHPFQDGNGRLSRVLTSLLLLQAGYSYIPYSSMESVIERNKEAYYLGLRRTQTTLEDKVPDWIPWLRFFLISLKRQKDHLASKLEVGASHNGAALAPGCAEIMDHIIQHGRITTGDAVALASAPLPTVKSWLSRLVRDGQLTLNGKGRGALYGRA